MSQTAPQTPPPSSASESAKPANASTQAPISEGSPRKLTGSDFFAYAREIATLHDKHLQACVDMTGHLIGEIPPAEFIERLLPIPAGEDATPPTANFGAVPEGKGRENDMYKPFVEAIEDSGCCPGFTIRDTSSKKDTAANLKPDCGLFQDSIEESDAKKNSLALMDIIAEIKPQSYQDAFHSTVNDGGAVNEERQVPLSKMTNTSIKHRGQQIEYASKVMALQHRSHVFSISIIGHYARLIRWDRAGALVSERFNYHDNSNTWLAEFLFHYSKATREQRGFDCHVQKASKDEVGLLESAVKDHLRRFNYPAHLKAELIRTVDHSYPSYKVRVEGHEPDAKAGEYIICRPFTESFSLCGRATRGYLAWGVSQQKLVFFKDTWRAVGEDMPSEAEIYKTLHDLKLEELVKLLPVVIAGGDVLLSDGSPQRTLTQDFTDPQYQWARPTAWLREHFRHRVVQELALPLYMVRNSKELLRAIRNTLEVIRIAYHKGGILHRDISAGNIMLSQAFAGILNDWDHAIRVDPHRESHPYRTGTWQFMSIEILQEVTKPHTIHDDVESTFWVFYYIALHFFKKSPGSGSPNLKLFDEQSEIVADNGQVHYVGGSDKLSALCKKKIQKIYFESKPLTRALHEFADILRDYHHFQMFASEADSPDNAVLESKGPKRIEAVEGIIKIFDRELSSDDWPDGDDAVEDQYPKQAALDSHREMSEARERSFIQALSAQSTGSRSTGPAPVAGSFSPSIPGPSRLQGEHLIRQTYGRSLPLPKSGSVGSGPIVASRTSSKRALNEDEDEEDRERGIREERVKRARKDEEAVKEKTGLVSQFVGALSRKVSKVFRGRKE